MVQLWKTNNCNVSNKVYCYVSGSGAIVEDEQLQRKQTLLFYSSPFPWTGNVKAQGSIDSCQKPFKNKSLLHYDFIVCMVKPEN